MSIEKKGLIIPGIIEEGIPEGKIILPEDEVKEKVSLVAKQIAKDYKDKDPILIGLLKGAAVYMSDLSRELGKLGKGDLRHEYIVASSYKNETKSSGNVEIFLDLAIDIAGEDIIIVEDVYDEGHTLLAINRMLKARQPASLEYTVLLVKEGALKTDPINIKYPAFIIEGTPWVDGYGIDTSGRGRGRPFIVARNLGGPDGT
jgi:hypoxanthine phosphoribosyltransferase